MELDSVRGLPDLINSSLSETTQNTVMLEEAELRRLGRTMASLFSSQGDNWEVKPLEHVNQFPISRAWLTLF